VTKAFHLLLHSFLTEPSPTTTISGGHHTGGPTPTTPHQLLVGGTYTVAPTHTGSCHSLHCTAPLPALPTTAACLPLPAPSPCTALHCTCHCTTCRFLGSLCIFVAFPTLPHPALMCGLPPPFPTPPGPVAPLHCCSHSPHLHTSPLLPSCTHLPPIPLLPLSWVEVDSFPFAPPLHTYQSVATCTPTYLPMHCPLTTCYCLCTFWVPACCPHHGFRFYHLTSPHCHYPACHLHLLPTLGSYHHHLPPHHYYHTHTPPPTTTTTHSTFTTHLHHTTVHTTPHTLITHHDFGHVASCGQDSWTCMATFTHCSYHHHFTL